MIIQAPHFEVIRVGQLGYRNGLSRVTREMRYNWTARDALIVVPVGMITDFASIPRGFRNIFSINSNHRLPALLHDFLYFRRGILPDGTKYTRKEADDEFYNAMLLEGVATATARTMYWAVRCFGHFYTDFTKENQT